MDDDIAGWLDILHAAEADHDVEQMTEARGELDRLLRMPVTQGSGSA